MRVPQAPEDVSVLSNMPAAYSLDIDNGLRRTGFPPTPAMSTYLLAIAAGHMVGTSAQACSKFTCMTSVLCPHQ